MSKKDKLINRLRFKPKDFTYNELRTLLGHLGFVEGNKGKTSGSAVEFYNNEIKERIEIHKPHPKNVMKEYAIKNILNRLIEIGVISDE